MANDKCINALYEKYALPQDNLRYCTIIYSNIKKFKSRYIASILALWYIAKNYKLFKVFENRMLWGQHCFCSSILNILLGLNQPAIRPKNSAQCCCQLCKMLSPQQQVVYSNLKQLRFFVKR